MNYFTATFQYMKKHALWLILIALIPCVLLSFGNSPTTVFDFLRNYNTLDLNEFWQYYLKLSDFDPIGSVLFGLGIVTLIVAMAGMGGIIETDMRVGVFKMKSFWKRVNNNIIAVIKFVLVIVVGMFLLGLLSAVFFYLWALVVPGSGAYALSIITAFILFGIGLFIFSALLMWLPAMAVKGFKSFQALGSIIQELKGNYFRLFFAVVFIFLPVLAIQFAFRYMDTMLNIDSSTYINILLNIFLFVYFVTLMFVAYHDIAGMEREDLNRIDIWKKEKK